MTTKLLLADDSATIQRVIGLTFAGQDVQVILAGDGEEAITRISIEKPDIVLADIGMPKRSGYEVSAFVKSHPELQHVPVVLLAGAFDPVDDVRAKEVGCDGVLVKPFEPQHVIATVRELIERSHLRLARPVPSREREERLPASEGIGDGVVLDAALDDYLEKINQTFAVADAGDVPLARSTVDLGARSFDEPILMSDLAVPFPESPRHVSLAAEAEASSPFMRVDDVAPGMTLDDLLSTEALPSTAQDELPPLPTFELNPGQISVEMLPASVADAELTQTPVPAGPAPEPASRRNVVAHAFSALLAAEQGEPWAVPPRLASSGGAPVVTDAVVDEVARRVFERLTAANSGETRGIVRQIVSDVAERLVREEIDRIRGARP